MLSWCICLSFKTQSIQYKWIQLKIWKKNRVRTSACVFQPLKNTVYNQIPFTKLYLGRIVDFFSPVRSLSFRLFKHKCFPLFLYLPKSLFSLYSCIINSNRFLSPSFFHNSTIYVAPYLPTVSEHLFYLWFCLLTSEWNGWYGLTPPQLRLKFFFFCEKEKKQCESSVTFKFNAKCCLLLADAILRWAQAKNETYGFRRELIEHKAKNENYGQVLHGTCWRPRGPFDCARQLFIKEQDILNFNVPPGETGVAIISKGYFRWALGLYTCS